MTKEQQEAHLRMLESLPRRLHKEVEVPKPLKGHRRANGYFAVVTAELKAKMLKLDKTGMKRIDIAHECQVSPATVYNQLGARRNQK